MLTVRGEARKYVADFTFIQCRDRADGALLESSAMSSIGTLSHELYLEEIARARVMKPEEKLLEGPRLFERACRVMADGIRHQHPELDEAGVRALLAARLARLQTIERR